MTPVPEIRAACSQELLSFLIAERPSLARTIRDAIPAARLEPIERAHRSDWLALELDRHVPAAVLQTLGEPEARAVWRSFVHRWLDAPLVRTAVQAAVRLFGLDPKTLVRITPRIAPLLYRNFFWVRAPLVQHDHAQLLFDDVHPDVIANPGYFTAIAGIVAGYCDVCNVEGELDFELDAETRIARVHLRWSTAAGRTGAPTSRQ